MTSRDFSQTFGLLHFKLKMLTSCQIGGKMGTLTLPNVPLQPERGHLVRERAAKPGCCETLGNVF